MKAIASAPAKVNLILHSGSPDQDGYHPLVTVFEALSLREIVVAEKMDAGRRPGLRTLVYSVPASGADPVFSAQATEGFAPLDNEDHLAYRAARALGLQPGVDVGLTVHKTVPIAGGMAGGSADAAASLVALNELFELGKSTTELCALGSSLGADVPACLVGGISVGTGRGDQMKELDSGTEQPDPNSHWWVLVLAQEGMSTPAVFNTFDRMNPGAKTLNTDLLVREINQRFTQVPESSALAPLLKNDLQEAALEMRPELSNVGNALLDAGALAWVVSGSGPTIAGLAKDRAHATRLGQAIRGLPGVRATTVTWGPTRGAQLEPGLPDWVLES